MQKRNLISDKYRDDGLAVKPLNDRQEEIRSRFANDQRIKYRRLDKCVLCEHQGFTIISEKDRYGQSLLTAVCDKCGLIFSLDQMREESAKVFYSEYYRNIYGGNDRPTIEHFDTYYKNGEKHRSAKFLKDQGVIVEIGTGGGWNLMPYRHHQHFGFDYNQDYLNYGKERYGLNLVFGGMGEARELGIKADYFILRHVLEHTNDPTEILCEAKDLLKDESIFNISVPSADYLFLSGTDLLSELQNAHNFLFDEFTLKLLAFKCGYETRIILGGNLVMQYRSMANQKKRYERISHALKTHPRGAKVIKYLKHCEKILPLKRVIFSERLRTKLHYFYYCLRPISVAKKYILFGRILSP